MTQPEKTPLDKRMRMHTPGQATWPDPDTHGDARCSSCRHFVFERDKSGWAKATGRCALVRSLTGKNGLLFRGAEARACTKYEGEK